MFGNQSLSRYNFVIYENSETRQFSGVVHVILLMVMSLALVPQEGGKFDVARGGIANYLILRETDSAYD